MRLRLPSRGFVLLGVFATFLPLASCTQLEPRDIAVSAALSTPTVLPSDPMAPIQYDLSFSSLDSESRTDPIWILVPAYDGIQFEQPTALVTTPDGSRVFIVEQSGRIHEVLQGGSSTRTQVFLDLTWAVSHVGFEDGLLDIAFDPHFASNGYFYISYTAVDPLRLQVARYSISTAYPGFGDLFSGIPILEIPKITPWHNGGQIDFGPDGFLYISVGDSDEQGDPAATAQNTNDLLGSILRIDVRQSSADAPYTIPPDNPFVGDPDYRPEIWAYGFRNPWRWSLDPASNLLFLADVGHEKWEEINLVEPGKNYGWNLMEGPECFLGATCSTTAFTAPLWAYKHDEQNCAVIGGPVYHGLALLDLGGAYIFGDYCSGNIWALRGTGEFVQVELLASLRMLITSFGIDGAGNLFVLTYNSGVFQLVRADGRGADFAPDG